MQELFNEYGTLIPAGIIAIICIAVIVSAFFGGSITDIISGVMMSVCGSAAV